MAGYQFSGSFANDKQTVSDMFKEVTGLVGDVEKRFANIKTNWVDPTDTKGIQLKNDIDTWISDMKTDLPVVEGKINDVFDQLDAALTDINNGGE